MLEIVEVKYKNNVLYVNINEEIGEDLSFPEIKFIEINKIIFDLEKLKLINSCGIREWVIWIKKIPPTGIDIIFQNCPRVFIEQLNLIEGLIPLGGAVESFFVPYYCSDCDNLHSKYYVNKNGTKLVFPKNIKCSTCGSEMDIDVIEKKYFKFLAKYKGI